MSKVPGIAYRRASGLFTHGLLKKALQSALGEYDRRNRDVELH